MASEAARAVAGKLREWMREIDAPGESRLEDWIQGAIDGSDGTSLTRLVITEAVSRDWLFERPEEWNVFRHFALAQVHELAVNSHKGNRPGWLSAGSKEMVSEVLYHAAKLSYATRQAEQTPAGEVTPEQLAQVLEFAADTANCAMMVADCVGAV